MDFIDQVKQFSKRVESMKETVQTYLFGDIEDFNQYSFDDEISVGIYDDLKICIADLLK